MIILFIAENLVILFILALCTYSPLYSRKQNADLWAFYSLWKKNVNIPRLDAGFVLCTQRQIKLYSTMDVHE